MFIPKNTSAFFKDFNYKTIENKEIQELFRFIMTSIEYSRDISIYNKNSIFIRDIVESNKNWENIYLDQDIFYLKLAKKWLVNIDFYKSVLDIKTSEWLDFYHFMQDYIIDWENYQDIETWKTKYDIDKILKNKYEEFIQHIILNIFPWDKIPEYVDEGNFENRIFMGVEIENLKLFFEYVNQLFIKKKTLSRIKEKIIQEYNKEKKYIEFRIWDYFKWYASIYEILKYLDKNWVLNIKDVRLYYKDVTVNRRFKEGWVYVNRDKMKLSYLMIRFELEKYVEELSPEFLSRFELPKQKEKNTFILKDNWDLYYWKDFISFHTEKIAFILLKEVLKNDINSWVNLWDIFEDYDNWNWDFKTFNDSVVWSAIKNINRRIKEKFKIESFAYRPKELGILKRKKL